MKVGQSSWWVCKYVLQILYGMLSVHVVDTLLYNLYFMHRQTVILPPVWYVRRGVLATVPAADGNKTLAAYRSTERAASNTLWN